jgi:ABC-2 type transport system permease protein
MPWFIQVITYFVPARYFITVARAISLKGVGLDVLWPQALLLVLFAFGMLFLARRKFEKKVF